MTDSSLFRAIQFTIALVFILKLFSISLVNSDQINEQAHHSLLPNKEENEKQDNHLKREKRSLDILEYLSERRRNRKRTYVLAFQMKIWLKFEIKANAVNNQSNQNKQTTPKPKVTESEESPEHIASEEKLIGPEYVGSEEKPIEYDTEDTPTTTVSPDKKKNQTIIYEDRRFIDLCMDPIFTSAECSLDGTEVLIYKGDKFYVMEDLKYGSGKLVASGLTKDLWPNFDSKGFMSMTTIKEGEMRGYTFAFYNNNERSGWSPTGYTKVKHTNDFKKKSDLNLPKTGFNTVIHNRDLVNPLVIGLKGKTVYYYKTENKSFKKVKEVNNEESDEKFPSDLTGGFVMSNGYIYMFQGRKYCVRELHNFEPRKPGVFCDLWMDNKIFLGCYGQEPPPYSLEDDIEFYNSLSKNENDPEMEIDQFCKNLKTLKFILSVDGFTILAFHVDKYWTVEHFLEKTQKIRGRQSAQEKWEGFILNPDTILIVSEGQHLRGNMFEFINGKYNVWAPNATNLDTNKKIEKFDAIIHNSDILNPMAVAFNQKSVYYYNTDSTTLKLNKTVDYSKTDENWPKGITSGLTIKTDQIYLFRGDTYCVREWKCSDKQTNCCKKWLSAKQLFHCP